MKTFPHRIMAAAALASALLLSACSGLPAADAAGQAASASLSQLSGGGTALAMLNTLSVKGKAAKTGYARSQFGTAWKDMDRNGCDTRNDILKRDLTAAKFSDKKKCTISSGTLKDPYTGKTIQWAKGSNKIDIDHLVALGQAWVSGAQQLSLDQRTALANDPLNLIAVDASANRQKGDSEASAWLPPNKPFRCSYVAAQVAVKKKYALNVTAPEKATMVQILKGCPKQSVPKVASIRPAGKSPAVPAKPAAPTKAAPAKPAPAPASPAALVSPGAYCPTTGAKGTSKAGKPYTCKTSPAESRLRWRA